MLAWDGGQAVAATVRCVEMDWSRGLQVTRSWSEPLRRALARERTVPAVPPDAAPPADPRDDEQVRAGGGPLGAGGGAGGVQAQGGLVEVWN